MLHDTWVQPTFCSSSLCSAKIEDFMELYLYSHMHLSDRVQYYTWVQLYLYIYKTETYLRGYVSFRWSVTVQTWVRCQPGPREIPCDWGTVVYPHIFRIYNLPVLHTALLIYNLSILQHHKIKTNLTLKPIRLSGYFNGYVLVYEPRHSQIRLCCPYAAHHIDAVCLKLFSLFGYVCSWEIFLQRGRVIVFWDVMPCN